MKKVLEITNKDVITRRKTLLEKIEYDPAKSANAWKALEGIWENRTDIDATTVRTEAWTHKK